MDEACRNRIKYYSGTGTYTKTVDVPAAWLKSGQDALLDLGDVRELADVMSTYKADAPLRPSGLPGPVRLLQSDRF